MAAVAEGVIGEARGRLLVRERAAGLCELCGASSPLTFAHRLGRGQGGTWAPSNGVCLCGSGTTGCAGWATGEPALAAAGGWRVVHGIRAPSTIPVWLNGRLYGQGWWLLDDDGCLRRVWPEDHGLPEYPALPPWLRPPA